MSVVKKITIQGIRSFNPHDKNKQILTFQTPLTIILGINGSGKTTIIESLKYAITNKFPPNCSNGSSFVNDPKMTNGIEALGVVSLEVADGTGNVISTTRRVKVSVKDKVGNLTKKEMDATITVTDASGSTKTLNGKCGDTKIEVCRLMGVSEAILNHVILCHQEESCWPLDEAKKVKEKFDSIFNTTSYIKCLDQLVKQDKELGQRMNLEKEKFKYVVDNLKIARKKNKDLEDKTIELKVVVDQIQEYETQLQDMERKLKDLQSMEKEYSEIANKVSSTEGKLEMVQKQVQDIKLKIKEELDGNVEQLSRSLQDFDGQNRSKTAKLKQLQQKAEEKDGEKQRLTGQQKSFLVEEGKYQQEETSNKERMANLVKLTTDVIGFIRKLGENSQDEAFSHSMSTCIEMCDGDPATLSPETLLKALSTALRARETEITKTKSQYEIEEKEIQKKIDDFRSKKASLETEIIMNNKQMKDSTASVKEIRNRLQQIEGSNDRLVSLEEELSSYVEQISSIEKSNVIVKSEGEIKSVVREIKELEEVLSEKSDEVECLSKDKSKLDQISIFKKQKSQKQNECKDILRKIEDDLSSVIGAIPEDILSAYEHKRESLVKDIQTKKVEQKQRERELTVNETELKRVNLDLSKKEDKIADFNERIENLLEGLPHGTVLDTVTKDLEDRRRNHYYSDAAVYLYRKYIKKLEKEDCCPICKRDIDAKNKTREVIQHLNVQIEKNLRNQPFEKANIEELQNKQKELLELKPIWDEKVLLESDEIPKLKERKTSLKNKVEELLEIMEDINSTLVVVENERAILDKYGRDVGLLDNARKEIKQKQESIDSIEKSRSDRAKELQLTTNLSEANSKLSELRGDIRTKQMEKDNKSDRLNKTRTELSKLQDKKNKVREQILKITSELQNREALEVQKKELEQIMLQLQEKSKELVASLPKAKNDMQESEKKKVHCINEREKELQTLRQEKDSLEKNKTRLMDILKMIKDFEFKKASFQETQKRSLECKRKVEEVEKQLKLLSTDIDSIKTDISNQEMEQRNIQDNLDYRRKLEDVSKLKKELDERKKLYASTENRGVAAEKRDLSQKHHDMSARMNQTRGRKREIQNGITELKKELGQSPFVNAEQEYVEKLVKKTVYEKAQKDVQRYRIALDQAILQFHTKRMKLINEILHDYWRKIYQGNDIDSIQIRTENCNTNVPGTGQNIKLTSGKGKKNYNYRVVMIRRGIELDMRGRCSAGQRVLASIIIRIALAESFSARCGIITLDEPTTNLDQKNINSLADALSGMAEKMATRNNFQLIVITHDQEFTDRLIDIDSVERYWKVSRDDMGFSQIKSIPKRGH